MSADLTNRSRERARERERQSVTYKDTRALNNESLSTIAETSFTADKHYVNDTGRRVTVTYKNGIKNIGTYTA